MSLTKLENLKKQVHLGNCISVLDKQSLKLMDIITENQKVVIDLEAERNQLKMLIKKDGKAI
tara:strand:+ start:277 stop:462 length:186 start_codon:yes stop_codon:yes gene_type:complete